MSRSGGLKPRAVAGRPSVTRLTQSSSEEDTDHLAHVGGDEVADELLHIVVNGASFLDRRHDGGEVVVSQDHLRGRLGNGSARAHGDANLRLFEGGGIVHSVSGHGGDLIEALQELNDLGLVG